MLLLLLSDTTTQCVSFHTDALKLNFKSQFVGTAMIENHSVLTNVGYSWNTSTIRSA